MNIKNPDTERLTRELARATGESLTEAITTAVRERLQRVRAEDPVATTDARIAQIHAVTHEMAPRLVAAGLVRDHDQLLYDERGLPR